MYLSDSKAFTKYSNDKDDIYKNIEEYFFNSIQFTYLFCKHNISLQI